MKFEHERNLYSVNYKSPYYFSSRAQGRYIFVTLFADSEDDAIQKADWYIYHVKGLSREEWRFRGAELSEWNNNDSCIVAVKEF